MFISLLSYMISAQYGDQTAIFSQTARNGECLVNSSLDTGLSIGNGAHTIHMRLTMPETYTEARQWILNLGQEGPGSHHWIWNNQHNLAIQFGTYGGHQIQNVDIRRCNFLTTTFSESTLKLYCDGVFMASNTDVNFDIRDTKLALGRLTHTEVPEGNFEGCIESVTIWTRELDEDEVRRLSADLWGTCRWEANMDDSISNAESTADYFGWSCSENEILAGFGLNDANDVAKIWCCELGEDGTFSLDGACGTHSEDYIDASLMTSTQGVEHDAAFCDANVHKVFTGAYDRMQRSGDAVTEILAGRCCEVECTAQWCAGNDWGVNTEMCTTLTIDPATTGVKDLVCPVGTLMTEIQDGDASNAHGLQSVRAIVCCELDFVHAPTFAPSPAPTSTDDCLILAAEAFCANAEFEAFKQDLANCLPSSEILPLEHRRQLVGRLVSHKE